MNVERRLTVLIAVTIVVLALATLWDLFRKPSRPPRAPEQSIALSTPVAEPDPVTRAPGGRVPVTPLPVAGPPPPAERVPSYLDLLARSQTRRRIRASAGLTYLNEVVAESPDSVLHRWDNRVRRPVRVFLGSDTIANFQPSFLDAVRAAFQRWEQTGVGVRFDPAADSVSAEVYVQWRPQFDIERTGQTDVTWDDEGHVVRAVVTLATHDPAGRPLGAEDVRVVALHEIGHLIGLDHSSDSTDLMYAKTTVRDLSTRDVATALLLYELAPGSLR